MATVDVFQSVLPIEHGLPPLLPPPKLFSSKGSPFIPGTSLPKFLPPPKALLPNVKENEIPPPIPPRKYSVSELGEPIIQEIVPSSQSRSNLKDEHHQIAEKKVIFIYFTQFIICIIIYYCICSFNTIFHQLTYTHKSILIESKISF